MGLHPTDFFGHDLDISHRTLDFMINTQDTYLAMTIGQMKEDHNMGGGDFWENFRSQPVCQNLKQAILCGKYP